MLTFFERRQKDLPIDFPDRRHPDRPDGDRRSTHRPARDRSEFPERRRLASRVRRYERELLDIPIRLRTRDKEVRGSTHDISPEGLLVICDTVLNVSTRTLLEFSFANFCSLRISGEVVSSLGSAMRIRFCPMPDWQKTLFITAVRELKRYPRTQEISSLKISEASWALTKEKPFSRSLTNPIRPERRRSGFTAKAARFSRRLEEAISQGLYPFMRPLGSSSGPKVKVNGREMLMLGSNNYLGLTTHPKVKEAAIRAIEKYGTGSGSTALLSGNLQLHEELENALAEFKGTEAAMLFSTGFMANAGLIAALFDEQDILIHDEKNHVSFLEGPRNPRCRTRLFRHNDIPSLERILKLYQDTSGQKIILTEGIFSMDGDLADLPSIFERAWSHRAAVVIDEAHATGILGKEGRGSLEHHGLLGKAEIITDSLGKALGSIGGYVAASKAVIHYLKHFSKTFIFTTSLPPSVCAALLAAVRVIREEPELRDRFWKNVRQMRTGLESLGFNLGTSNAHIIPLMIGDETRAYQMTRILEESGVFVTPVMRPAVKRGEERIRVTVMATHTSGDLERALEAIGTAGQKLRII